MEELNNLNSKMKKRELIFGLVAAFLCGMGFTIISPVVPFLVQPYVNNAQEQAIYVTLLTSVYAACVFFAAPGLGALSDRYGRRPVLLICLLGTSVGYFIFGIGGSLLVLFIARITEGITGGSVSTIFAYFADITPVEQRTKYFGWLSAVVGAGTAIGPTLGGMLAKFDYSVPMFFGAAIALLNFIFGYLYMPESLDRKLRLNKITLVRLNPFTQLKSVFSIKNVSILFIVGFLLWIANGSFQAIFSQFSLDTFKWSPVLIGMMFSIIGIQDILSQALIMPRLIDRLSDKKIALIGMCTQIIGYIFIAISALLSQYHFFIIGMFTFGFGDSIFGPSFNGMISKSVDTSEQGRVLGGSQSIQSLARIIGPIIGGQIYVSVGHFSPALMGVILITISIIVLYTKGQKYYQYNKAVNS